MSSGGSISFKVTAYPSGQYRNITFYNFGSFSLSPNPSNSEMQIDLNPELEFNIQITSLDTEDKLNLSNYKGRSTIDIRRLRKGNYAVEIKYKDKVLARKKLIISGD